MARINHVIRAFDLDELKMLSAIIEREKKRIEEDGSVMSESFSRLRQAIQDASRYANEM